MATGTRLGLARAKGTKIAKKRNLEFSHVTFLAPGARSSFLFLDTVRRHETVTQGVFGNRARLKELQEIIGTAGLGADAGQFQAAEGLALDHGAGDAAV